MSEERSRWQTERTNHIEQLRNKQEQAHSFEINKKYSEISLLQEKIKELQDCISEYRTVCSIVIA